jgi:predicted nucleic acid-binding Zn ribbon protein
MEVVRTCRQCGDRIRGRSDKKFCSDACRNAFNNLQNEKLNASIRQVNSILKRNRKILEKMAISGKPYTRVKKQLLLSNGFCMPYLTHTCTSRKGTPYFFCYEYGYCQEGEDVIIVRKQSEGQLVG